MAILRPSEIRKMDRKSLEKKLDEFKLELSKEMANIYIGANVTSPGKIRETKRTIARIKTILNQQKPIKEESS